jgi:hypothetical protein
MKSSGDKITQDPFTDIEVTFEFGDNILLGLPILSMNKARRMGWTGFVDPRESLFEMYSEMAKIGMIPPMKVHQANPLI